MIKKTAIITLLSSLYLPSVLFAESSILTPGIVYCQNNPALCNLEKQGSYNSGVQYCKDNPSKCDLESKGSYSRGIFDAKPYIVFNDNSTPPLFDGLELYVPVEGFVVQRKDIENNQDVQNALKSRAKLTLQKRYNESDSWFFVLQ